MSEPCEPSVPEASAPAGTRARGDVVDLLAFLGTLLLVGGVVLLVDSDRRLSARLVFAGAAGLAAGCVMAWRRLRRPEPRRFLTGQVVYRGARMSVVSAWGVHGQPLPAIEPPAATHPGHAPSAAAIGNSMVPGETTIAPTPDLADAPGLIAMTTPAPPGQGARKIRSKPALERLRGEFSPAPGVVYDGEALVDNLPDDDPS